MKAYVLSANFSMPYEAINPLRSTLIEECQTLESMVTLVKCRLALGRSTYVL